jgi:hypothetical protein
VKRFIVETSLYDPIEVDISGKVYQTQPLSRKMIQAVNEINGQCQKGEIDSVDRVYKLAALIFGSAPEEFDSLDIRALTEAVEYSLEALNSGRPNGGLAAKGTKPEDQLTPEERKN